MTSNRGREPRPADGAVLVIGLLGIVLVCGMCVAFAGWLGFVVASPLVGMLLIATVAFS